MFISVFDLFKVGIGPSSSHTMGPMLAAQRFRQSLVATALPNAGELRVSCTLKGSLALTGKGHASDKAVLLGLHGYTPDKLLDCDVDQLVRQLSQSPTLSVLPLIHFDLVRDLIFDRLHSLPEHPNGMIFELKDAANTCLQQEIWFSIGGGFIHTQAELRAAQHVTSACDVPYGFASAREMLQLSANSQLSIAAMKAANECEHLNDNELQLRLENIWQAMSRCLQRGLNSTGELPGGLHVKRRAQALHQQLLANPALANLHDWLSCYAMAVNEENAAGHPVVTAPTNGAAGVIPAILYYQQQHHGASLPDIKQFLLVAAAIGGLIKHNSSISGAEVGCQGEIGAAAAMAAAGLCAMKGGNSRQIEHAAEIALEHHLGLTCDPVKGLVQVPCIERNAFGAIKAYTAASLALRDDGQHIMQLDACIAAMKQTGQEMSHKFKETSLGGLAVSVIDC